MSQVDHVDVVIIGGGTTGCIAAAHLSEDPTRSVLVIERGRDLGQFAQLPASVREGFPNTVNPPMESAFVGQSIAGGSADRAVVWAWGEVLGGGSAINGQVFLRPLVHDTDDWVARGAASLSYDSLLPSMIALESDADFAGPFHGQDGPIPVQRFVSDATPDELHALADAARSIGFDNAPDLNAPGATGVGPTPFNARGHERISTAVAYLDPARGRPNLRIMPETLVERIVVRGDRARGVAVVSGGVRREITADLVVLAAGAIATPQLLMLSGIGPRAELDALGIDCEIENNNVGENLQDHPMLRLQWRIAPRPVDSRQPMSPLRVRFSSSDAGRRDDLLINVCGINPSPNDRASIDRVELITLLMDPDSTGRVRLASADAADRPTIDFSYFTRGTDRSRMLEGIDLALEIGRAAAESHWSLLHFDDVEINDRASRHQWLLRNALDSGLHATGSCRMGDDDSAVVDSTGCVRGVEGLMIIDASVVPSSPRVNTNATAMVIAHHLVSTL